MELMTSQRSRFDTLGQLTALRRYARSLTRDDVAAEDLVHDTLLRAYERRGSFEAGRGLRAWLFSILHNLFVDGQRARRADERRKALVADLHPEHQPAVQDQQLRLAQLRRAFMDLPDEQRAALHLVAIEGMSFAEAAKALGIPSGTLMSRLARARAALRALEEGEAGARRGKAPDLKIVGGSDGPSH
ncbi:sigma-70 family RNA polymerase sigma factor [Chelatococcus daeguensis]|uniref:RNA polymerase sigma factor, sigma-70 family n=2 Tax=Chelatococcaceae TaxID=2036754 RepID=A0ABM9U3X4_9HYPH|nr:MULTISPECIES: sigma-70 family RNA polymerase sigma factor [Chelatococcus]MBM3083917.1 sigma-70 family RNA polymerase sigma factor [Chelatococcus daeguensis]CUA87031.1 RNA polymerase sigma factor, sigma-70 family [Chelatococcus sambhunathii]